MWRLGTAGLIVFLASALVACVTVVNRDEQSSAASAVGAYFAQEANVGRFSGVVLIARGDEIQLEQGYGFADVESAAPMRAETILRIGSLTKPITASAVLVAVRDGRLSLDDPICPLLPAACPTSWSNVQIRHLLSHTSGIRDHFGDLGAVPVEGTAGELARVLTMLDSNEPLASSLGESYAYSNFNYVLLGVALERAFGEPWEVVLRRLVLEPVGARNTAYDDVWAVTPGRARGYDRDERGALRNIEYDDHAAYAAGGLRSSARDLLAWSRAVFSGSLMGEELTRQALTPGLGNYGFGWQIRQFFGRTIHNHTGGIDGFSAHLAHYPDSGLTIIVISNDESDAAILRACDAAALWFGIRDLAERETWAALAPPQRCGVS